MVSLPTRAPALREVQLLPSDSPQEFARLDVAPVSLVHPILHCWAFLSGFLQTAFPSYFVMRHQHSRTMFRVFQMKNPPTTAAKPPTTEAKPLFVPRLKIPSSREVVSCGQRCCDKLGRNHSVPAHMWHSQMEPPAALAAVHSFYLLFGKIRLITGC